MQKEYDNIDIEHILDHPFLYIQIHQSRNLLRSSHFNTTTAFGFIITSRSLSSCYYVFSHTRFNIDTIFILQRDQF